MSVVYKKLIVGGGLLLSLTALLLVFREVLGGTERSNAFFPRIQKGKQVETAENAREYLTEKISQRQQNGTDMRSDLYLTHHRFFLEKISGIEVKYKEKTFTLNDVCFKPHTAIFKMRHSLRRPYYMERLFLEMERMSPCLMTTPLNCFYDSHLIHSQISHWNESTAFLNRRLRNAYIEGLKEEETNVFVKESYGPKIVKEWASHMLDLAKEEREVDSWAQSIQRWISSIEPRNKICADPLRSCHAPDAENYFNICIVMQHMNDFEEKRRQKLKFELEKSDEEFTTKLDCLEDREKFIEWMQERELRSIMKTFSPSFNLPDHQNIVNQRCDGIFHDSGSDGIEFFDGSRTFSSEENSFDSIRTELTLMTPENLHKTMKHIDEVNGHESIWSVERATELLNEFRFALRDEVVEFNKHRASMKIKVITQIETDPPLETKDAVKSLDAPIYFVFSSFCLLLIIFNCFVWSANPFISTILFLIRIVVTSFLYSYFCNTHGVIVLDEDVLGHFCILVFIDLFITSQNSMFRERLARWIHKLTMAENPSSNFSSIDTVGSLPRNPRRIMHTQENYADFQAAQDTDSHELFEQMSLHWPLFAAPLLVIFPVYCYFLDQTAFVIFILLTPSVVTGFLEEYVLKIRFTREKYQLKEDAKHRTALAAPVITEQEANERLSGERQLLVEQNDQEQSAENPLLLEHRPTRVTFEDEHIKRVINPKDKIFGPVDPNTYDASCMSPPTAVTRRVRLFAVYFYFNLLAIRRSIAAFLVFAAILWFVLSVGILFTPIPRTPENVTSIDHDDLFIDFEVLGFAPAWYHYQMRLAEFSSDLNSIQRLKMVANWERSFDRFEKRKSPKRSFSDWINQEPISWVITAPRTAPNRKNWQPDPFKFRLRYEIENSKNESMVRATVQQLDDVIAKHTLFADSIRVSGLLYEHYHQNTAAAAVWNPFPFDELLFAAAIFFVVCIIVQLFATTPQYSSTLLFAFFVVATRVEVAALFYIFCIEQHWFYLNFATLITFLSAFPLFADFCRFRSRIIFKKENRTSPELQTGRRIRLPFIAFVDTVHLFAAVFFVLFCVASASFIFAELHDVFCPVVILIGIQIGALLNSVIISLATRLVFEMKVLNALKLDLVGDSVPEKLQKLLRKPSKEEQKQKTQTLPITPPESPPGIELNIIEKIEPERCWAPPPKPRKRELSEDSEEEEQEDMPGPSTSSSLGRSLLNPSNASGSQQGKQPKQQPLLGRILPSCSAIAREPWHQTLCGEPFNHRINYETVANAELYNATGQNPPPPPQHPWLLPDHMYFQAPQLQQQRQESDEEKEDVDSRGDPDEECLAEEERQYAQMRARADAEREAQGTSGQPAEQPMEQDPAPQDPPQPVPNLPSPAGRPDSPIEEEDDDEGFGLDASPSPPPYDVVEDVVEDVAEDVVVPAPPVPEVLAQEAPPQWPFQIINGRRMFKMPVLMVEREHPRDPLREPPNPIEYMQQFALDSALPRHPAADLYPAGMSYAEIAYCEDPFWSRRLVPIPPGTMMPFPRRESEVAEAPPMQPPPEDFTYQYDPNDPPPIDIPRQARALYEDRRDSHVARLARDGQNQDQDGDGKSDNQ